MAWSLRFCQASRPAAAGQGELGGSGRGTGERVSRTGKNLQPEQTLLALDAHCEQASRAGPKSPTFSVHRVCQRAAPGRPTCAGPRSPAGGEFTDLALRLTLPELGRARQTNERAPRRARLLLRALIGSTTREAGLAGRSSGRPRVQGASGSGTRAPRRPPPPVPPRRDLSFPPPSLPPSLAPSLRSRAPAARWRGSALHSLGAPQCSWDGAAGCRWHPESARSPGE